MPDVTKGQRLTESDRWGRGKSRYLIGQIDRQGPILTEWGHLDSNYFYHSLDACELLDNFKTACARQTLLITRFRTRLNEKRVQLNSSDLDSPREGVIVNPASPHPTSAIVRHTFIHSRQA